MRATRSRPCWPASLYRWSGRGTFGCSTKWADKRADAVASLEKWDAEPALLERLDEPTLAKLAANDTDKLRLVNVWATWCGPAWPSCLSS